MKLRDYQEEALTSIIKGGRRLLGFAATGLGKSTMIAELARRNRGNMLIITPTREITFQIADKMRRYSGVSVGIEMANYRANVNDSIVIATIQTLRTGRYKKFLHRKFDYIIVDEAHHAHPYNTYANVLSAWGMGTERGKERAGKLVFLTATPNRTDGVGLGHFVDEIAFSYNIQFGVEEGWLVPPVVYEVTYESLISEERAVLDAISEGETPALAFVSSVRAIHDTVEELENAGYSVAGVWGDQFKFERRDALEGFANGSIDVIIAHNALTEGWDAPHVRTLVLSRGTESDVLYTQMVGRGLRPNTFLEDAEDADERKRRIANSDKPHVMIYDLMPKVSGRQILTIVDLIGEEPKLKGEKSRAEAVDEEIQERTANIFELAARTEERIDKALRMVNILTGRIEEDGIWWFPVGDFLGTYVDNDPLDPHGTPAVYYVEMEGDRIIRYNLGGWVSRLRRPKREYATEYRKENPKEFVKKLFKKYNVTMPTRITKKAYLDAGLKPRSDAHVPASIARRVRAASKVLTKFNKISKL